MATKRGQKAGGAAVASNGKAPAPSPANAWARPLKTSGPPPGMGPADKVRAPTTGDKPNGNGAALSSIHRDRLLHLSLALIGQKVVANLTDGSVLEGVFHTFTPFDGLEAEVKNKYVLNTVQVVKPGKDNTIKNGSTVILAVDKVTQLYAKSINLDRPNKSFGSKGATQEFETDTQISGTRGGGSRDLVAAGTAWTNAPGGKQTRAEALAGALDDPKARKDTSGLKGNIGGWDQFQANQKLFNVKASFDENLYTTELDKSQIDSRKIAEAERIAKEIETTTSSNMHVAEERGQAIETDYDEEDRYSGVLTKEGKQRHEDKSAAAGAPKKIMNYAAAAAKADAAKKAGPGGVASKAPVAGETKASETAAVSEDKKAAPAPAPRAEEAKKEETEGSKDAKSDEAKEGTKATDESTLDDKKADEKPKNSKLNANAKSFTFNPSAKSFTPTFGMGGGASFSAPQQQPQHMPDPNMQVHAGGHPMQPPHYMHAQMGQPGMMPMMNPQYPGMRYPPQFAGMDQQGVPQMQGQPQHAQGAAGAAAAALPAAGPAPSSQGGPAAPPTGDAGNESAPPSSQEGEPSQPAAPAQQGPQSQQPQPPQQQQQQPMQMPYNVPPQGAYFAGGAMGMHPRGPGGYPPQFVGGPQQIPVGPQGAPYGRQMYPMPPGGMPPNMMRGPGGAPYYAGPNGPMPYPPGAYGHGMMDEGDGGFRGRGGRGQGRGRGGRGRRGGRGTGRGHYQNNHQQQPQQYGGPNNSGRSTPQQQAPDQGAANGPPVQPQAGEKPAEGSAPEVSS